MTDRMKYALSGAAAGAVNGLFGGLGGGFVGGRLFQKVSNLWLRRIFACFLLYGGVRYLL